MTHTLRIPGWHPTRLNLLMGSVKAKIRLKKRDRNFIIMYGLLNRIPKAEGRRRITIRITLARGQRAADPDAYWKSLLDGLVLAGLLRGDSKEWVELMPVRFARAAGSSTEIILEDIEPLAIPRERITR